MGQELHLEDETFQHLFDVATEKGLTPEQWIAAKVKEERLQALKHEIKKGIDSLDRGEGKPFDAEAIKARGRTMLEQRKK